MHKQNGYVMDSVYPSYFYPETQPLWLSTIARLHGLHGPDLDAPYRYCELGCGTGFNAIVAAALNPVGHVTGVDFNPRHIALATALARDMGLKNIEFICCDFQQFLQHTTRQFDFMNCHGVWSWVAPASQRNILEIVARHLTPKGLFCLHYMCHPGSTPMLPVQHLVRGLIGPATTDSRVAVAHALDAVDHLLAIGYADDQPRLKQRLRGLRGAGADNLAHDLLSDYWSVQHASEVHRLAAQASLSFVGSADMFYNLDPAFSMPRELQPLLKQNPSPAFVETLKDMASGRPHRADVFQKNAARPSGQQYWDALNALTFRRNPQRPDPDLHDIATPFGPIDVTDDGFLRILALADRQSTFTFSELGLRPASPAAVNQAVQAITIMLHAGLIHPAQNDRSKADAASIAAINRLLTARNVSLQLEPDTATGRFSG